MEKYTLNLNDRDIQLFDNKVDSQTTIIGIHGLTGNGMQLSYYADKFGDDNRFITMDLYGRANSKADGEDNNIQKHVEDIKALISTLELENVTLMGYSMGAFIAATVASTVDAVKSVVLLDGAATMSEHQRPIVEPGLGRLSKHFDSKEQYVNQVATGYESFGIETTDRLKSILSYEIEEKEGYWENKATENLVRNDWESFWAFDPKEVGPKISQPVLLVQASGEIGTNPPLFLPEHYEDTIEFIKDIQVVVSDANHYTMVFENRDDINNYISEFLKNK